jgi:hypothetical protein
MRTVIVRYQVKPDRLAEHEQLARRVYEELEAAAPAGFRYATLRLDDDISFVHIAQTEDDAQTPLPRLQTFRAFTADIADRCEIPPDNRQAEVIGSYRLLLTPDATGAGSKAAP